MGYCSSNWMTSLNVPSSKGVFSGPIMTAFQRIMSFARGTADIPAVGSCWTRLKSRIRRFRADVDIMDAVLASGDDLSKVCKSRDTAKPESHLTISICVHKVS